MTRDDAVEIVLRGRAFEECKACEGKGRVGTTPNVYGKRHNSFGIRVNTSGDRRGRDESCLACQGYGLTTIAEYAEACQLLGIEGKDKPYKSQDWPHAVLFDERDQEWVVID